MSEDYQRQTGKRVKQWGWEGDIDRLVEATGEYPIMYQALGSQPRTEHPFNVYGDIKTQPAVLRETLGMNRDAVGPIADKIIAKGPTHILGCGLGTSQFVAQVAAGAFWKFAGLEASDIDSLEFILTDRPYDFSRLAFFAHSGSGSTVDSIRAAKKAREAGAYTLAFTSIAGSPIMQVCEDTLVTAGGFDTGGSDTFHYTARLAAAVLLALALGERQGHGLDYAAVRRELFELPERFAAMFDGVDARCRTLARRHKGRRAVLVVGSGANLGTAEEIALKYDEMASIPTKAMCPGRHLHGAIGLTDEQILTILIAPPGPAYPQMIDIARATQMLKAPSIAIVSESDNQVSKLVDDVIRLPTKDEVLFSLLAILPGQLLPYWSALEQGNINPDCQRSNIAKYARVWHMLFPPGTH
jgi:glucosamine 6-phosphate synthetase-like amidotransferase/phosphosugar isomerase protein